LHNVLILIFSFTWDEHLFEVVLPRPCVVGHVDVKFTFQPLLYTAAPNIQITLLKQNITNIGRQTGTNTGPGGTASATASGTTTKGASSASVGVDTKIDFNMKRTSDTASASESAGESSGNSRGGEEPVNNVLDPLFLESHNAEILCGPVNLSTCLDLSGNCGIVSLTSPQLLLQKPRSFLLHLKGFPNKSEDGDDMQPLPKVGGKLLLDHVIVCT
jgi:baculoviral IAP repeat-containing protein 6